MSLPGEFSSQKHSNWWEGWKGSERLGVSLDGSLVICFRLKSTTRPTLGHLRITALPACARLRRSHLLSRLLIHFVLPLRPRPGPRLPPLNILGNTTPPTPSAVYAKRCDFPKISSTAREN